MKLLFVIIILLLNSSLFAGGEGSTGGGGGQMNWKEIDQARDLKAMFPPVQVGSWSVPLNKFCKFGVTMQAQIVKTPCPEWQRFGPDLFNKWCLSSGPGIEEYETPLKYVRRGACSRYEMVDDRRRCVAWHTEAGDYSKIVRVGVFKVLRNIDHKVSKVFQFKKEYKVPHCYE